MRRKLIPFRCCARLTAFRFALLFLLAGCAALTPEPPAGALAFALMGDVPYSESEVRRLDALIGDLNSHRLDFVVHVGDITSGRGPCTDEWLEARKRQFAQVRYPFVLLPGDNEWTDCHRSGFDPMERLAKWRTLFCFPEKSFSGKKMRLERQTGEYCEHIRWEAGGAMFVALNVPGGNNNLGRTVAMDAEHERRMFAVFEWLDESIAAAESRGASHVILLMQADPFVERTPDGFARLRSVLTEHARSLKDRLVLVHGDTHLYKDDEPLPGLRRIEVWGSRFVAWLRGSIEADKLYVDLGGHH